MAGHVGTAFRLVVLLILLLPTDGQHDVPGTLLFLHVWKCGGTTLRQLMCDWADREGLPCATVAGCRNLSLQVPNMPGTPHDLVELVLGFCIRGWLCTCGSSWLWSRGCIEQNYTNHLLRNT